MGIFGYIIAFGVVLSLGVLCNVLLYAHLHFNRQFTLGEFLLHSFLLGFISNGLILFILGRVGISYSFFFVISYSIVIIATMSLTVWKYANTLSFASFALLGEFHSYGLLKKIIIGLLGVRVVIKLVIGGISILHVPTYQDDAFVNWNYRTKVFFYRESLVLDSTDKDYLGQGYKQYPLSTYLNRMYMMKLVGTWSEGGANSVSFIFYLSSLLLIFYVIYDITKRLDFGLGAVYLLSSIPLYYVHGTAPYFDVLQSVYVLLASYYAYFMIRCEVNPMIAGIYIGILGFTKSEGLIVYTTAIFGGVGMRTLLHTLKSLSYKSISKNIGSFLFPVILINLPFILFKLLYGLGFGNGDANVTSTQLSLHREIFPAMYQALFLGGAYNMLIYMLCVALLYYVYKSFFTKRNLTDYTQIFVYTLLCCFAITIFIYFTTFTYTYVLDQTGVNRTMMQFVPNMIVIIVLFLYQYLSPNGTKS